MKDQGLVIVMGGDRSCSQPCFLFVSMTCSMYKGPLVYITVIMVLGIVQYSFCKLSLKVVVVVPICILLICHLYFVLLFVVLHYGPLTVSLFAWIKFDILWDAMLGPICRVLYIFYYGNVVLPMF